MTSTGLVFLRNEAGETEGLNDPGIETFRDSPYASVARETGQNTRDVRADESRPVKMVFRRLEVPTAEFPAIESYKSAVATCLAIAEKSGDTKELNFFHQAEAVLSQPFIPVLEIADFNTGGLRGPCEDGTPFHALVKATGVSAKDLETSGGSFGIGKNAVYAASDLQTAFYSTIFEGDDGPEFLCQGKTRLRSFTDDLGVARRSVGYWGVPEGLMPVSDIYDVPEWLRRSETGTSIFSIAMRDSADWVAELIASIVMNFFAAIHDGEMEFEVGGEAITANNLLYKFDERRIVEAASRSGAEEDFRFARDLYGCLRNEEAHRLQVDVPRAGKFDILLCVSDGLPRRIAVVRNGMFITDSLEKFGDKLRRFPMFRDFVALVRPAGKRESVWLKQLENPRHDQLSAERLTNPEERESAKQAGKILASSIREAVKSVAKGDVNSETDLDELSEFFANEEQAREDEEGHRDPFSFRVRKPVRPTKLRTTKPPTGTDEGDDGGNGGGDNETETPGGGGEGTGEGDGTGGSGSRSVRKPMPLLNPRTQIPDPDDLSRRVIWFTPMQSGTARLKFQTLGLSNPEDLKIVGGWPEVECAAAKRQKIEVEFELPYGGPIEIVSWSEEVA